jgi:hypothetical protein
MALQIYKIATTEVPSSGSSTISFNSIPQGYTDLHVVLSVRSTGASTDSQNAAVLMAINGVDTNRVYKRIEGYSTNLVSTNQSTSATIGLITGALSTASTFSTMEVYVPNYSGSGYKTLSCNWSAENNNANNYDLGMIAGFWASTAAITSLSFTIGDGANFAQYSTATLYGIL